MVRSKVGRFIAVDGESITLPDGEHRYVLLTAVTWRGDVHTLRDVNGISTARAFDFLLSLSESYRGILCGFAWQYDLNMQMRDVYRADVASLAMRDSCYYRSRTGADYTIRNMAGKITKILRGRIEGKRFRVQQRATIYDVFGFFQCSFVRALQQWDITQDTAFIEKMKAARSTFSESDLDEMERYNVEECRLLIKLIQKVCDAFSNAGYILESYHGAGAAGAAILKRNGVRNHIEEPPDELRERILQAYFGGRIQCVQQGVFTEPVYQLDINSAYPAAMRDLPSLMGGEWRHCTGFAGESVTALYRVQWHISPDSPVSPFPFRWKGIVHFPTAGEGWYWNHEVASALEHIGHQMVVLEGYTFTPTTSQKPFAFINAEYDNRRRYKDAGRAEHLAIKLALNSMYGKNAQSMGGKHGRPPYQSFVWAGITTSWARAAMYRLAMLDTNSVITIATDGLLSTRPIGSEESRALGGLERSIYTSAFVFGPGRYLLSSKDGTITKTRGFEGRELDWSRLYEAWLQKGIYAQIPTTMTRFIGYKSARHLNRWGDWRTWARMEKVIKAGQFQRAVPHNFSSYDARNPPLVVRWDTYAFSHGEVSEAYKPKQTLEDIEKVFQSEQPL